MSNWLGFSLTPHLEDGEEEALILPLSSESDAYSYPKFEDFLGCSPPPPAAELNMNVPPQSYNIIDSWFCGQPYYENCQFPALGCDYLSGKRRAAAKEMETCSLPPPLPRKSIDTFGLPGIDGPEDMKLISGIIVVERKDKQEKEGKLNTNHKEVEEMNSMTKPEFVAHLRRHHQHGRWQARIGRVACNKDLYLGTFSTQKESSRSIRYCGNKV